MKQDLVFSNWWCTYLGITYLLLQRHIIAKITALATQMTTTLAIGTVGVKWLSAHKKNFSLVLAVLSWDHTLAWQTTPQTALGCHKLENKGNLSSVNFQSKKKDSNQEAREFFGLLDLYTQIQQEILGEWNSFTSSVKLIWLVVLFIYHVLRRCRTRNKTIIALNNSVHYLQSLLCITAAM